MLYTYNNYYLDKFKYNIDKKLFDKIYKYSKIKIDSLFNKFNEKDQLIMISSYCIYLLNNGLNIENIDKIDSFLNQLSINNNENFYAIVNLILPYLDDKNSSFNQNSTKINFPLFNVIDTSSLNNDVIKNIPNINDLIKESNEMAFNYSGLNLEDIYNCLVNDFYLSIKRIKWLIFNNLVGDKIYLNIKILDDLLGLDNIYNESTYSLLSELDKKKFEKNWTSMKKLVKSNKSFKSYKNEIIVKLFRSLVIYFEFNYNKVTKLEKEKKYKLIIKENIEDLDKVYDKYVEFDSIKLEKFINAIDNVPSEDIYNFLFEEFMYLKNTIFYDQIFIQKKVQYKKISVKDKNIDIPPKYYYNYAKNLYEPYSEENQLKNLWSGLSIEQKYMIVHKLNLNENDQNWFKITKILSEFDKYDNVNII